VTGRKRAKAVLLESETQRVASELRQSEERFSATFEQAAVGMAQIGLDGTFLRVSATLCAMIGYTREELLACKIQDVIHPDDLEADVTQMKVLLTGELTTCVLEERLLCKEGGVVWVYLTRSLLRDRRQTVSLYLRHRQHHLAQAHRLGRLWIARPARPWRTRT
jgi:two-component system, NarL family, sensor histidine kinase UhpB